MEHISHYLMDSSYTLEKEEAIKNSSNVERIINYNEYFLKVLIALSIAKSITWLVNHIEPQPEIIRYVISLIVYLIAITELKSIKIYK